LSKATVARSADLQSAESRGGPQHPADWKSALPPKKDGKIY